VSDGRADRHCRLRLIDNQIKRVPPEGEGELHPLLPPPPKVILARVSAFTRSSQFSRSATIQSDCFAASEAARGGRSEAEIILFVECITSNYADPVAEVIRRRARPPGISPRRGAAECGGTSLSLSLSLEGTSLWFLFLRNALSKQKTRIIFQSCALGGGNLSLQVAMLLPLMKFAVHLCRSWSFSSRLVEDQRTERAIG